MILAVDVDGVLADFVYGFTSIGASLFGTPVYSTVEQRVWDELAGMDKEQMSEVWGALKASPFFWHQLPSLATEEEWAVLALVNERHDLYFPTSRVGIGCKLQTERWISDHGIRNPTVVITDRKGELANSVGADAVLDDKPGNVLCVQYLSKATPYILDRKYNRFDSEVIGSRVVRVATVLEFVQRVTYDRP